MFTDAGGRVTVGIGEAGSATAVGFTALGF